jgi:transcriptional regulator with XRE-family HTH domain
MYRSAQKIEGLREVRLRVGLTQQQLADLSGLLRQHVSALENHRLLLTDERASRLAPYLGVHPSALVVGHAAFPILRGVNNKTSVTENDLRALLRAFSVARTDGSDPRLRLELVRVVREASDALFSVWRRLLDDAQREAKHALEAGPG